ncbi:gamma-glutamyltransferase [Alcaligenaceae bacterium]|nr:gamma-glutamyltransferase [Alcaligenaceae bacterium]
MVSNFASPNLSQALVFDKPETVSRHGVVATQNRAASEAGIQVLREGGNAIDAAVAAALVLTVTEPWMSSLGGGGALLSYSAKSGTVKAVDFSMISPATLDPDSYGVLKGRDADLFGWPKVVDDRNVLGAPSVAVPGVVAGLSTALAQLGTRSWADILQPAIEHARQGFQVDWYASLMIAQAAPDLQKFSSSAADFLPGGHTPFAEPPTPGAQPVRLSRQRLLATLERLASAGPQDFYEGEIAASIVADVQAEGGYLSMQDMRQYRAKILEPAASWYRGQQVCVVPGLNGGPTLQAALAGLAQRYTPGATIDAQTFVAHAASIYAATQERLATMGDHGGESCTTHLSVVDAQGNMVALTQTLLSSFGSRLTLGQSGLLMNNGVMWFDPVPGRPNSIGPGKRPLCNFCPVLVLGDKGNYALGGSGGRKIMPALLGLISFLTDHGLSLRDALNHPRIDVSGNPWITADHRMPPVVLDALAKVLPVVRAERTVLPVNFTIALGVGEHNGQKFGATESSMPWAEALAQT